MKEEQSSVDLYFMIKELQYLVNSKVDKIYEPDYLLIQLHVSGQGLKPLKITDKSIYVLSQKEDMPSTPTQFATILRKRLGGAILREISQIGFERIITLKFQAKEKNYFLVCELFGGGNILLVDDNNVILYAKKYQIFKDRATNRGVKYEFPKKNILEKDGFVNLIKNSDKENISKALALEIGLGGFYAEELCARANIDKSAKIIDTDLELLFFNFQKLLSEKISANVCGADAYPIKIFSKLGTEFPSFSQAIDSLFEKQKKLIVKKNKEIEKCENIIKMQGKTVEDLLKKSQESKRAGELIYENYALVKEIVDELAKASKTHGWLQVKKKLNNHKIIKEINEKEGKIKIVL